MRRRSFLAGLLAGAAAPAIVRAESLMKLWVPPAPRVITLGEFTRECNKVFWGWDIGAPGGDGTVIWVNRDWPTPWAGVR
jgi:hypothetical protein